MKEIINSVGIDIGTSTTQLIFSKLTIKNQASSYMVPRIDIINKEVVYRSEIYFTPLKSTTEIDAVKVKEIVSQEYKRASMSPSDMDTGAVIITGETARKQNANEVLDALSNMAGDFVVATAGPDLESVLSARGAGADVISEEERTVVANLDIGGGTTNIAIYEKGNLKGLCCLDIGGRLIKIEDGKVSYIFHKISKLAQDNGISIKVGDNADIGKLNAICALMAEHLAQSLYATPQNTQHSMLYTNDGKPLPQQPKIVGITYSGGVADCIYNSEGRDVFQYGDIGVLLGKAIQAHPDISKLKLYKAVETIRATVVGAGTHTTEVSGSTVTFDENELPVKNIPILRVAEQDEIESSGVSRSIISQLSLHKTDGQLEQIAISLSGKNFKSFNDIQNLAEEIIRGAQEVINSKYPLIVVMENDIGKAVGNAIRVKLEHSKKLICLDSISAKSGDYIDIGLPVAGGRVVPVVIKTLIFNS